MNDHGTGSPPLPDNAASGGLRIGSPASSPCRFCPYRRDAPSEVWHAQEYAKLASYDLPTMQQLPGLFTCHLHDEGSEVRQRCAGWAGCHDGDELLALHLAAPSGLIDEETLSAIRGYTSLNWANIQCLYLTPLVLQIPKAVQYRIGDIHRFA